MPAHSYPAIVAAPPWLPALAGEHAATTSLALMVIAHVSMQSLADPSVGASHRPPEHTAPVHMVHIESSVQLLTTYNPSAYLWKRPLAPALHAHVP